MKFEQFLENGNAVCEVTTDEGRLVGRYLDGPGPEIDLTSADDGAILAWMDAQKQEIRLLLGLDHYNVAERRIVRGPGPRSRRLGRITEER